MMNIFVTPTTSTLLFMTKMLINVFVHSLQKLDELLGLDRRWVDDLVDVLAVAVCIGGGDVNEGLEVVHLLGQAEELLRGDHVQLQGVSAGEKQMRGSLFVWAPSHWCYGLAGICRERTLSPSRTTSQDGEMWKDEGEWWNSRHLLFFANTLILVFSPIPRFSAHSAAHPARSAPESALVLTLQNATAKKSQFS